MTEQAPLWETEPLSHEFTAEGFECRMLRPGKDGRGMVHWCGYIRIPPGHPWHGLGYYESEITAIEIHGGVTYAENRPPHRWGNQGGAGEDWWLGFDCAHTGDTFMPEVRAARQGTYRDMEWVEQELRRFAAQAKEAAHAD